jgi:hypothetical protein
MVDDPTIRRCMGFARREGRDGIVVLNLFALRATSPRDLVTATDPVGRPDNDAFIAEECLAATGPAVVAWGATMWGSIGVAERVLQVRRKLEPLGMVCLGRTNGGYPRHPLYVRADQPFERWP